MRVTIYQPQYFPRLHYFNRILTSDVFVLLESAQYVKSLVHEGPPRKRHKSYQSDTPIKSAKGTRLLTLPIKQGGQQAISQTQVHDLKATLRGHFLTIQNDYSKSAYFHKYKEDLHALATKEYHSLADLNTTTILWATARLTNLDAPVEHLSIEVVNAHLLNTDTVRLQQLITDPQTGAKRPEGKQKGTEWTTNICKALGATEYVYGGTAQSGYMNIEYYQAAGIQPVQQDWALQEYHQLFHDELGFIPNLSILDLLFNTGQENALRTVTSVTEMSSYEQQTLQQKVRQ